jgi:RNA polymerase sigma-70 factor (ECF subfamily)
MNFPEQQNILNNPIEFEKFFKEKYRSLCFVANRYVKDINTAEEIVQDVFVKIWEKRNQIVINGSISAYITTSVKNNCLNYLKHVSIVKTFERTELTRLSIDSSDNEEEMLDIELESAILKAIAELPPQRKKVFMLSRVDGLKYHEIAEKLGLSVKTIEAQMGKALKQLRVKLKDYVGIMLAFVWYYFNAY